jgi:hypothetical protein
LRRAGCPACSPNVRSKGTINLGQRVIVEGEELRVAELLQKFSVAIELLGRGSQFLRYVGICVHQSIRELLERLVIILLQSICEQILNGLTLRAFVDTEAEFQQVCSQWVTAVSIDVKTRSKKKQIQAGIPLAKYASASCSS